MSETLIIATTGYVVTLLVAIGGWVFGYRIQNQSRRLARLEKRANQLKSEVRARIALENAACEWLAGLTNRTSNSVKLELRDLTEKTSGLRPEMSNSALNE
jgi:hypothetical protein